MIKIINKKVGFFGAGFSKWCINLPLVKDLFDFKGNFWKNEKKKIEKLKPIYLKWKEENPSKTNEDFISEVINPDNNNLRSFSKLLTFYICRRLSEPFIWEETHIGRTRRHTYNLQGSKKREITFKQQPQEWLLKLDALITTNYDLIIEYLLGIKEYNYSYQGETLSGRGSYPISQYKDPVKLTGIRPLLKLHGSISWTEKGHHTDGRGGLIGEAIIIPPNIEKSPFERFEIIWNNAREILKCACIIIFFGFAFNTYDKAVYNLLKVNISDKTKILIVDPFPNKQEILDLFSKSDISHLNPLSENGTTINSKIISFIDCKRKSVKEEYS